jgi:hypothetical protein
MTRWWGKRKAAISWNGIHDTLTNTAAILALRGDSIRNDCLSLAAGTDDCVDSLPD